MVLNECRDLYAFECRDLCDYECRMCNAMDVAGDDECALRKFRMSCFPG